MSNAHLLMVFFGVLGLVCLLLPRLIVVLYKEITNLGSGQVHSEGQSVVSLVQLNAIRIAGVGILAVVGLVYFF